MDVQRRIMQAIILLTASIVCPLMAAQPHLQLTADRTTAAVGEDLTVTLSVIDAPAFACWGATVLLPAAGMDTTGQAAGATPVFVADSRERLVPGARFGGYTLPAANHAPGDHVLGRVTVRATVPGTYVLRAPAASADQPFGGVLLPATSAGRIVPTGDELTVTITGSTPMRDIVMDLMPGYLWDALAPADARVAAPADGTQTISLSPSQDAVLVPAPGAAQ